MTEPFALGPIQAPAAWRGSELARTDECIYQISAAETAVIERLVAALRRAGTPRERVTRDEVQLDVLVSAVRSWRDTLARGRGFVLVRGLPIDHLSDDDAALAYWALGLHLGTPVPQNVQGELLTDVRDTGADPTDASTRLSKTRAEQDFTPPARTSLVFCVCGPRSAAARAASSAQSPSTTRFCGGGPSWPPSRFGIFTGTTSSRRWAPPFISRAPFVPDAEAG